MKITYAAKILTELSGYTYVGRNGRFPFPSSAKGFKTKEEAEKAGKEAKGQYCGTVEI